MNYYRHGHEKPNPRLISALVGVSVDESPDKPNPAIVSAKKLNKVRAIPAFRSTMQSDYGIEKNRRSASIYCLCGALHAMGRGEDGALAEGSASLGASLAGDLTGSRPCLCDVLVPAYTAICVIYRRRKLIEKRPAIFATYALRATWHLDVNVRSCVSATSG